MITHPFDCEGWLFELKWDGFPDLANLVQVSFAHLNRLSLEFHSLPA
jgi:hypothetical protein